MARPFRFGVQVMNLGDHDVVAAAARQAEDLGYDDLYSYDHLGAVDPFVPLVVAAEATSTLRVGPLVLNNELYHPALLARTVATADRMTGGRIILGLGTGYARSEHDAMGIELRPPKARVERLEESLTALRSLLHDGAAESVGEHHRLAIADLGVRPIQDRVPILVGGNGRRVIGAAGRLADIFQFTGLSHRPDGAVDPSGLSLDAAVERARWLTDAEGDRVGTVERSLLVQRSAIGDGGAGSLDDVATQLGIDRDVVATSPFFLAGTASQVVERLEALREILGISHVVVRDASSFAPIVAALAGQ